jgi:hypothetical protein
MASGKTTAADYLIKKLPGSKKLTLAGAVKDIVNNIDMDWRHLVDTYILPYYEPRDKIQKQLGLDISEEFYLAWHKIIFETRFIPPETPKPRKRLQFLGTDGARKRIDNEIWIKIAEAKAKKEPDTTWIIDDCRFENEFNWFERRKWQPIFLHVSRDIQIERVTELYGECDESIFSHPSEKELDNICVPTECIINADRSAEKMLTNIKEFLCKKGLSF